MPATIAPMRATSSDDLPDDGDRWGFEIKWDGFRTLAFVAGGSLRLQSRKLLDSTNEFPHLAPLAGATGGHEVVLDGEVCALDDQGRSRFDLLQQRSRLEVPVVYLIFDLLYLDGRLLLRSPYVERRGLLASLDLGGAAWSVPTHHVGDGPALLEASRQRGLEGLVAKRLDSRYEPGRRSRSWIKVKNRRRQELVVGGWLPGRGAREGGLGALLVGYHEGGSLRYAGRVGTGFSDAELGRLEARLRARARDTSPFVPPPALPGEVRRRGRFVAPDLVVEVAFMEWTPGPTLRAPVYLGSRDDKPAREVVREP